MSVFALRVFATSFVCAFLAWFCDSSANTFAADEFPAIVNSEKSLAKPMDPSEVVKTAKLPSGFELSVFAAEPNVQNPIAITTDERGRLWVAEWSRRIRWKPTGSNRGA